MIREYYPRIEGEAVDYPPPITPEGGDFKYEFPSGNGVDNQEPPYAPGPPHWCTDEYKQTGNWADFCPYVFEGPDAGKVRFLLSSSSWPSPSPSFSWYRYKIKHNTESVE